MSFGNFFSYTGVAKSSTSNSSDNNCPEYISALIEKVNQNDNISSKERTHLFGYLNKNYKIVSKDFIKNLKPTIEEYVPILVKHINNLSTDPIKETFYQILDDNGYDNIFNYIKINFKGNSAEDEGKMCQVLLGYIINKMINQEMTYDDINNLISSLLKTYNYSSKDNITTYFALLTLCYAFDKEEFIKEEFIKKNYPSIIGLPISGNYILMASTTYPSFPIESGYLVYGNSQIFKNLMTMDKSGNVTVKHKSKVEQIIHMVAKYILNIIRVSTNDINTHSIMRELLTYLSQIQQVTDIEHILCTCPLNLKTMMAFVDTLKLKQKTLDIYKKRILTILTTNPKACGCQFTEEIVDFEAVFSKKFIFAGSDYSPLEYKYVKQKAHFMANTHYEPVFKNSKIVNVKCYIKPHDYSNCVVSSYLNCFKFKNKEHQNYILNYYDCDAKDDIVSIYVKNVTNYNDNKKILVRMKYDMPESEKRKCKKYYFNINDIINIDFKTVIVNDYINTDFTIDMELFTKMYNFERFHTPEYETFFKDIMSCTNINDEKFYNHFKYCFPNINIKVSKLVHSPAEKNQIHEFSQKFYGTYLSDIDMSGQICQMDTKILPLMILTNYMIYNINALTLKDRPLIFKLLNALRSYKSGLAVEGDPTYSWSYKYLDTLIYVLYTLSGYTDAVYETAKNNFTNRLQEEYNHYTGYLLTNLKSESYQMTNLVNIYRLHIACIVGAFEKKSIQSICIRNIKLNTLIRPEAKEVVQDILSAFDKLII